MQPLPHFDVAYENGTHRDVSFSSLIGHMLVNIEGMCEGSEAVLLGSLTHRWLIQYEQDCCASCDLIDVVGDPEDLIGWPILDAREESRKNENEDGSPYDGESCTWTFYILTTAKGTVTLRWYGSSNGYYSEEASLYLLEKDPRA